MLYSLKCLFESQPSPSHSLSISQTGDVHEWFILLPAIILPFLSLSLSLQPCFLKYACPTFFFPTTLQNSNACPSLVPVSPLPSSALFVVDPISRSDPSCSLETVEGESVFYTDRQTQKAHQPASMNASALPIGVPTHSDYENSPALLISSQTRHLLLSFAWDGWRNRRVYCTIHTSCSPLYYLQLCERSKDSAIVSLILCNRAAENPQGLHISPPAGRKKKKIWAIHQGQKSGFSLILPRESRAAACVFIWPHIVT